MDKPIHNGHPRPPDHKAAHRVGLVTNQHQPKQVHRALNAHAHYTKYLVLSHSIAFDRVTIRCIAQEQLHSPALGQSFSPACLDRKDGGPHLRSWSGSEREQKAFLGQFSPVNPFPSHSSIYTWENRSEYILKAMLIRSKPLLCFSGTQLQEPRDAFSSPQRTHFGLRFLC